MVDCINTPPPPPWLSNLTPAEITNGPLPIDQICEASVYHPACGTDATVITALLGNAHSFVYCDIHDYRPQLNDWVASLLANDGWRLLARREFNIRDLLPEWALPTCRYNPDLHCDVFRGWGTTIHLRNGRPCPPLHARAAYVIWAVYEKSGSHPQRFSLLFVCNEGICTYKALYPDRARNPHILVLPITFYGPWYIFYDSQHCFVPIVQSLPMAMPPYVLRDVNVNNHVWNSHPECVGLVETTHGHYRVMRPVEPPDDPQQWMNLNL